MKNDARHLSLFRDYKPLWEKEEVERTERWKKFLICLAEDRKDSAGDSRWPTPCQTPSATAQMDFCNIESGLPFTMVAILCSSDEEEIGLQQLEAHWHRWREVSEGANPDSEAVLQQLRSLVQAGIPLVRLQQAQLSCNFADEILGQHRVDADVHSQAVRGRLWKLFLGTDKKRTAGVYEKLRRRALGSRASRSKRVMGGSDGIPHIFLIMLNLLLKCPRVNLQKQHQEVGPSDTVAVESPESPGDARAELDVRSRLLGTQSIGRVESSYLQALDAAEGQEGKHEESPLPEPSLQPLPNSAGHTPLPCLPCEQAGHAGKAWGLPRTPAIHLKVSSVKMCILHLCAAKQNLCATASADACTYCGSQASPLSWVKVRIDNVVCHASHDLSPW